MVLLKQQAKTSTKKPSVGARSPGRPPPPKKKQKTSEPPASHVDGDAREVSAARSLIATSSSAGPIEDTIWHRAVVPAPTSPDELDCSASRDNGLPAVDPAAAPSVAVDPHTATVDHAPGKLFSARSR